MGRGYIRMVAAVLVMSLVIPGPVQMVISQAPGQISDRSGMGPDQGPGPRFLNDIETNSTGAPSYFASLMSIAGMGNIVGGLEGFIDMDVDGDDQLELAMLTAQGFAEILGPPDYGLLWRTPLIPGGARSITNLDIDGDGIDELAVGDGYGTVHVFDRDNFINRTLEPAFKARIDEPNPVDLITALDMDGDTRVDILAYSGTNCNMTLIRNTVVNGSIILETNISKTLNRRLSALLALDLDGDGQVDLLGGDNNHQIDRAYLYQIDTSDLLVNNTIETDYPLLGLDITELDGDDIPEILAMSSCQVSVHDGATLNMENYVVHLSYKYFYGAVAGDVDNDGRNEIVLLEWDYDIERTSVVIINGTSYQYESRDTFDRGVPIAILRSDIDNDSYEEVLIGNNFGLTSLCINTSASPNYSIELQMESVGYNAFGLDSLDWDDDGIKELIIGSAFGLISVVDPTDGSMEAQTELFDANMASLVVGDVDLDGEAEIVAGNSRNTTVLYKNLTVRKILAPNDREWDPPEADEKNAVGIGDIDGDDDIEVLVGTGTPSVYVFDGVTLEEEFYRNTEYGRIVSMLVDDTDDDGLSEVLTGDTQGYLRLIEGATLGDHVYEFMGYGPFGFDSGDVDGDGEKEIVLGTGAGKVYILNNKDLSIENDFVPDLGLEAWGIQIADIDDDGTLEIFVGTGDGNLYVLNGSTLETIWMAELGEWIGSYNSIVVEDLDGDGRIEVAVGSDGFIYVLRLLAVEDKPDLIAGELDLTGLPGKDHFEHGEQVEVVLPVTVVDHRANFTIEFWMGPRTLNVSEPELLKTMEVELEPGVHDINTYITAQFGDWKMEAIVDPSNRYSEKDEANNIAEREFLVMESYASVEWYMGQGTGLGRYQGLDLGDDDGDGVPELMVGNFEGFVQSYHVDGVGTLHSNTISEDLGTGAYGILVKDIDSDGEVETVVSTADGWVFSFEDNGGQMEWRTRPAEMACYGLSSADIDMDGNEEVVVGCGNSRLYVLDGTTGDVLSKRALQFELWAMAIGDLFDDGTLDVVVGAQDGNVTVLRGKDLAVLQNINHTDDILDDIEIADIDLDGSNEIVLGGRGGLIYSLGPNGTGALDFEDYTVLGSAVKGIEVVDLFQDHGPEVVVATEDGITVMNGTLDRLAGIEVDGKASGILAGDVDRDGQMEVVAGTAEGHIHIMATNGSWSTDGLHVASSLRSFGSGLYGTAAGDSDGDLAPELLIGTSSGELRIFDGISKAPIFSGSDLGASLYGLKVADVDGDGNAEVIMGSGDEKVCAYDGKDMEVEWCTDALGNWTIALDALDTDLDGDMEVVVGAGDKVHILNGIDGSIEHSSFSLGDHILGLATGNLDNDSRPEIAVGTDDGFLHMLDGNNLTKQWGVLLDSWPVGLAIVDMDGDGIGTIFAGTDTSVYEVSLKDKEVRWELELGQSVWGITAGDFDGDDVTELFIGTREGKVMAFNGTSMAFEWSSKPLGLRPGWYNSLEVADVDWDGQNELLVGSSGYIFLFGSGAVVPDPVRDAVVQEVLIPMGELTHSQKINVTAIIYNHATVPIQDLTVHMLHDGSVLDSTLVDVLPPLGTVEVEFPIQVVGGGHNISIVVDRYDSIAEYNELNNNVTISYYALQEKNLAVIGGEYGIYLSSVPVQSVELTVFATVVNTGEELAQGTVRFYWGDLKEIGDDTVTIKGNGEAMAAIKWTPEKAGTLDLTVVVFPHGTDSDSSDDTGSRKVRVLTHPSIGISDVSVPPLLMEWERHELTVTVKNMGEANTTARLALASDGDEVWSSAQLLFVNGDNMVKVPFTEEEGAHVLSFSLKDPTLDLDPTDNTLQLNVTVLSRPDLTIDTVTRPEDDMLKDGRELVLGTVIRNKGGVSAQARLKAYDNGQIFFDGELTLGPSNITTVPIPWKAVAGDHELTIKIMSVDPTENVTDNNDATIFLTVKTRPKEAEGLDWAIVTLLVLGILAPVVAVLIYYSQVAPVRAMYRQMPVDITEDDTEERVVRRPRKKVAKRPRTKKKVKKKETKTTEEE